MTNATEALTAGVQLGAMCIGQYVVTLQTTAFTDCSFKVFKFFA